MPLDNMAAKRRKDGESGQLFSSSKDPEGRKKMTKYGVGILLMLLLIALLQPLRRFRRETFCPSEFDHVLVSQLQNEELDCMHEGVRDSNSN